MTSGLEDQVVVQELQNNDSQIVSRDQRCHLRWVVFLACLSSCSEESIVLWVHSHKSPSIEGRVVIVQLKLASLHVVWLIGFPSNSMKDSPG